MCELGSGGVSLTSMARRTLGVGGMRAAAATYLFLHYALLVACASLHSRQARAHGLIHVSRKAIIVVLFAPPLCSCRRMDLMMQTCAVCLQSLKRAKQHCCLSESRSAARTWLRICRFLQSTIRWIQALDDWRTISKARVKPVKIKKDVLAVQTQPRRAP